MGVPASPRADRARGVGRPNVELHDTAGAHEPRQDNEARLAGHHGKAGAAIGDTDTPREMAQRLRDCRDGTSRRSFGAGALADNGNDEEGMRLLYYRICTWN